MSRFRIVRLEDRIVPSALHFACYDPCDCDDDHDKGHEKLKGNNGVGNGLDPQPPGDPPINDGPGTSPGNPGNRGGFR